MSTVLDSLHSVIGKSHARIEGPLKVSGSATYTSDINLPDQLYAVPVGSTIASGKITSLEFAAAEAMPGVHAILHRGNVGRFYRISGNSIDNGFVDEARPPFEDDVIRYYGQYVALVVADTFEAASAAAGAVKVGYDKTPHDVSATLDTDKKLDVHSERGDPDKAFD